MSAHSGRKVIVIINFILLAVLLVCAAIAAHLIGSDVTTTVTIKWIETALVCFIFYVTIGRYGRILTGPEEIYRRNRNGIPGELVQDAIIQFYALVALVLVFIVMLWHAKLTSAWVLALAFLVLQFVRYYRLGTRIIKSAKK